jgi:hypothetical protein
MKGVLILVDPLDKSHLIESREVLKSVYSITNGRRWKELDFGERSIIKELYNSSYGLYLSLFHLGYGFKKIKNGSIILIQNGYIGEFDRTLYEAVKDSTFDPTRITHIMWACFVRDIMKYDGQLEPMDFIRLVRKSARNEVFTQSKRVEKRKTESLENLADSQGIEPSYDGLADYHRKNKIKETLDMLKDKIKVQKENRERLKYILGYLGRISQEKKDFNKSQLASTMVPLFGGSCESHRRFATDILRKARAYKSLILEYLF